MTNEPKPLPVGRVFPARDPVSQFAIALSMAINDLSVADRHLHRAIDTGSTELSFYFRLLAGYFHELGLLFRQARRVEAVAAFVAGLGGQARDDFDFICRFEGELAAIRTATFHFPKIGDERLAGALDAVKGEPARIVHDDQTGVRRMEFADHVAMYMSFGAVSDHDVATLTGRLSEAVDRIARFGRAAMNAYPKRVGVVQKGPARGSPM
jgi:hypothetical protein